MSRIMVFFGLIASGKSTLAEQFARQHRLPYSNTDRVRKELAGLAATEHRPGAYQQGIYSSEFSRRTYQALLDRAAADIRAGRAGVVLDGSYHRRAERDQVRQLAAELAIPCTFVLCQCGDEEVKRRLAKRARDPQAVSDGRWEIYLTQKETFEAPAEVPAVELIVLNTEVPVAELLAELNRRLVEFEADS
ncbi:MAG: AAA family ATPase [Desulfobulbaceae bacterium]